VDLEGGASAGAEEPAQHLPERDGKADNNIVLANQVLGGEEAHRKLPGDRYHPKTPIFTGNEDVE